MEFETIIQSFDSSYEEIWNQCRTDWENALQQGKIEFLEFFNQQFKPKIGSTFESPLKKALMENSFGSIINDVYLRYTYGYNGRNPATLAQIIEYQKDDLYHGFSNFIWEFCNPPLPHDVPEGHSLDKKNQEFKPFFLQFEEREQALEQIFEAISKKYENTIKRFFKKKYGLQDQEVDELTAEGFQELLENIISKKFKYFNDSGLYKHLQTKMVWLQCKKWREQKKYDLIPDSHELSDEKNIFPETVAAFSLKNQALNGANSTSDPVNSFLDQVEEIAKQAFYEEKKGEDLYKLYRLHYQEGHCFRTISVILNKPQSTLKSQHSKIKKILDKLRTQLNKSI